MWLYVKTSLVALLIAMTTQIGQAQEAAPPLAPVGAPAGANSAISAEAAAFQAAVNDYKQSIRAIEDARTEFQVADPDQRETINMRLQKLVAATQPKVNAMVEAAIEAYRANPGGDEQVTELLLSVVEYQMVGRGPAGGGDDYEAALPILEALIAGGHEKSELPVWAFLAAFTTNDYEAATKYAELAKTSGALQAGPGEANEAQETFGIAMKFLRQLDDYKKLWAEESAIRAAEAAADDLPRVKFATSKGDVVIELFENEAPIAVANFITLVKKGYYDGIVFHRVLSRFMAQGGDPTGSGSGGPGYSIACECYGDNIRKHFRGTLSMAHAGRDTGGSQFFLTFLPTDHLDGKHTVFGRVVEGFGVLGALNRANPQGSGPQPPTDKIISAEVLRDRGHSYEFKKLAGR